MVMATQEKISLRGCVCNMLKPIFGEYNVKVFEVAKKAKKIGKDDPRTINNDIFQKFRTYCPYLSIHMFNTLGEFVTLEN